MRRSFVLVSIYILVMSLCWTQALIAGPQLQPTMPLVRWDGKVSQKAVPRLLFFIQNVNEELPIDSNVAKAIEAAQSGTSIDSEQSALLRSYVAYILRNPSHEEAWAPLIQGMNLQQRLESVPSIGSYARILMGVFTVTVIAVPTILLTIAAISAGDDAENSLLDAGLNAGAGSMIPGPDLFDAMAILNLNDAIGSSLAAAEYSEMAKSLASLPAQISTTLRKTEQQVGNPIPTYRVETEDIRHVLTLLAFRQLVSKVEIADHWHKHYGKAADLLLAGQFLKMSRQIEGVGLSSASSKKTLLDSLTLMWFQMLGPQEARQALTRIRETIDTQMASHGLRSEAMSVATQISDGLGRLEAGDSSFLSDMFASLQGAAAEGWAQAQNLCTTFLGTGAQWLRRLRPGSS